MPTFALVAEGITDQAVVEGVLRAHCRAMEIDDVDIACLQPLRDATDEARAGNFGGWERVFEYCTSKQHISEALSVNDYLVIHLDTDCAEHENFGVKLYEDGVARSTSHVVKDVTNLLVSKLSHPVYEEFEHKIIFAIAVHSIECWLLPLFCDSAHEKSKIYRCEDHLSAALRRKNMKYRKYYYTYYNLIKKARKKKHLTDISGFSESFEIFLRSLPVMNPN
jgi:hypothetical protein